MMNLVRTITDEMVQTATLKACSGGPEETLKFHSYLAFLGECSSSSLKFVPVVERAAEPIHLCHTAAILSRETKKALFYHAEPRGQNRGGEALRGKTKLFWSPGTIWPPCDKGEYGGLWSALT